MSATTKIRWWAWQARKFGSEFGGAGEGAMRLSPQAGIHTMFEYSKTTVVGFMAAEMIGALLLPYFDRVGFPF
jgi:hypothetical protein